MGFNITYIRKTCSLNLKQKNDNFVKHISQVFISEIVWIIIATLTNLFAPEKYYVRSTFKKGTWA